MSLSRRLNKKSLIDMYLTYSLKLNSYSSTDFEALTFWIEKFATMAQNYE